MGVKIKADDLIDWLEQEPIRADISVQMLAQEGAKKMQNYAKKNRPWTDRTGHARQRLVGYVENMRDAVRINIAHGVEYGVYLENSHEKRYAILQPTVNALSTEILKGFNRLFERIGKQ